MRFTALCTTVVSAAFLASVVNAHGYVSQFYVNDKGYLGWAQDGPSLLSIEGIGKIMDVGTPQIAANNPQQAPANDPDRTDLSAAKANSLTIGGNGIEDTRYNVKNIKQFVAEAKGGDTISLWQEQWPTGHMGGSWNMMASCGGSCKGKKPEDLSWFKISEDNYDPETKVWPMIIPGPNKGIARMFTLPTKLPGGEYLLSCTLLAVHSFDGGKALPQYYPTAWRIKLADSGVKTMPTFGTDEIGKIPEMYTRESLGNDASTFNVNQPEKFPPQKFRLPGVKVWEESDSVIKDATKFKPKAISVTEDTAAAVKTLAPDESPIPSSVPSEQPASQDTVNKCTAEFKECGVKAASDAQKNACSVTFQSCVDSPAARKRSTYGRRRMA